MGHGQSPRLEGGNVPPEKPEDKLARKANDGLQNDVASEGFEGLNSQLYKQTQQDKDSRKLSLAEQLQSGEKPKMGIITRDFNCSIEISGRDTKSGKIIEYVLGRSHDEVARAKEAEAKHNRDEQELAYQHRFGDDPNSLIGKPVQIAHLTDNTIASDSSPSEGQVYFAAQQHDKSLNSQPGVPENLQKKLNARSENLKENGRIDEAGHWQFENPRLRPEQQQRDVARHLKELLWDTFNPSPGKVAKNNGEFAYQFLTGTGKDIQEHIDKNDPVLKDFISSPGANAIRQQFANMGFPGSTDKLGFGTFEAAKETALPRIATDPAKVKAVGPDGWPPVEYPDYSSVAFQVGGFGNPPKNSDTPWARASAVRIGSDGNPNDQGKYVQYQVVNIAGMHSFWEHLKSVSDKPIGSNGPERSLIQVFRWTEELPSK